MNNVIKENPAVREFNAKAFHNVIEEFFDTNPVGNYVKAHTYLLDNYLDSESLPDKKFVRELTSTTLSEISFLITFKDAWDKYKRQIQL